MFDIQPVAVFKQGESFGVMAFYRNVWAYIVFMCG